MQPWLWLSLGLLLVACGQQDMPPATTAGIAPVVTGAASGSATTAVVIGGIRGGKPGDRASASVTGPPNTRCTIAVMAPDGRQIRAAGLEPKNTDAQGRAIWTWQIATNTPPGIGMVDIACGGVHAAPVRLFIG